MVKKKARSGLSISQKRALVDPQESSVSINGQLELIGLSKMGYYYQPRGEKPSSLRVIEKLDEWYTRFPFYGSRRMTACLRQAGFEINRKRVVRLMQKMGLEGVVPRKSLSTPNKGHVKYPYLLKGLLIEKKNQVWSTDITYIRLKSGNLYLTAVMDWHTRFVLSWRLSNTLDVNFCLEALEAAFSFGLPEIFNTDQGSQYTSREFVKAIESRGVALSMDGRGRAHDNIFIERLWRSVKYEEVYLKRYENAKEAKEGLSSYLKFYNEERPHQSLGYRTPQAVYRL